MCGILGKIGATCGETTRALLEKAAESLALRGPDDAGTWVGEGAGLAHRRLSIIDVSHAGHQPMVSLDGRYVIVYNGEIYNHNEIRKELDARQSHQWQSGSDTETILAAYAAWGPGCLARFHGMFAFAIWDLRERRLFAARDRMGVKPFYYCQGASGIVFASRPRALFLLEPGLSPDLDEQALRYYLEAGYVPAPHSVHREVRKLPPAHYLVCDASGVRLERYWDYRQIRPETSWAGRSEEELLDELDHLVTRSVESRLISDVPLGAFLSGGIDSSLVVAIMARRLSRPVKTFTIGFDERQYDESSHAEAVAGYLGTEHHCERLKVADLLTLLPQFQKEYDEPFFDSSAFPVMAVSRLARRHVTVSLSGDGGDELFGGYHYYRIAQQLDRFFRLPKTARRGVASLVGALPQHRFKLLAGALGQPDRAAAFAFSRSIAKDYGAVLRPEVLAHTRGIGSLFSSACQEFAPGLHPSEQGMRLDAFYTLPDDYLQKVDVASMAFSLESRDPLLDQDLVEWAMKLPVQWKLKGGVNKYLLRKLAYRYVPREILDRPKQGFGVPIDSWLRGPLRCWAEERLNDRGTFDRLPLDQGAVLRLWNLHQSGARNVHPLLWAVLMFLNFYECYGTSGSLASRAA